MHVSALSSFPGGKVQRRGDDGITSRLACDFPDPLRYLAKERMIISVKIGFICL